MKYQTRQGKEVSPVKVSGIDSEGASVVLSNCVIVHEFSATTIEASNSCKQKQTASIFCDGSGKLNLSTNMTMAELTTAVLSRNNHSDRITMNETDDICNVLYTHGNGTAEHMAVQKTEEGFKIAGTIKPIKNFKIINHAEIVKK